eukprot:evm.model.scf_320.2 EVM.evm.TU.scf_320.2   scf_320:18142-20710(-)
MPPMPLFTPRGKFSANPVPGAMDGIRYGGVAARGLSQADLSSQSPVERQTQSPVERQEAPGPFDWTRQWYAVAPDSDLDPGRPMPFNLLGRKIVVWRDGGGRWRAFDDACPHRLAPLSQGRIEPKDGSLMCAYHGWRFGGAGECLNVPQAEDERANAVACASRRSRVATYPAQLKEGILWIWPDSSPSAFIDSAVQGPKVPSCLDENRDMYVPEAPLLARDNMYGHNLLLENNFDVSHVPFAHHGVIGNRANGRHLSFTKVELDERPDRERLEYKMLTAAGTRMGLVLDFPGTVSYQFGIGEGKLLPKYVHIFYCTPTLPGQCRLLYQVFRRRDMGTVASKPRKIARAINLGQPPTWFYHMENNAVADGDIRLIHNQGHVLEQIRRSGGPAKPLQVFYMPTGADRPVFDLVDWYHDPKKGGGGPRGPDGELMTIGQEETREEVLLDRYEQHTRHCRACSGALRNVELAMPVAQGAIAALSAVFLSLVLQAKSRAAVLSKGWPLIVGAVVCGIVLKLLVETRRRLKYLPYDQTR